MVFFVNDEAVLISHASSGDGQIWREVVTIDPGERRNENGTEPIQVGLIGESFTPGGVFVYDRMRQGRRQAALGGMYDPAYFNFGIAVHGANEVPLYPASHGCVRMARYVGERFQQFIALGDQVFVWDGYTEPEELGAQARRGTASTPIGPPQRPPPRRPPPRLSMPTPHQRGTRLHQARGVGATLRDRWRARDPVSTRPRRGDTE